MPKIQYEPLTFKAPTLAMIQQANTIIAGYQAQGYDLTLRQLYYQFVARDLIPNTTNDYKRLGDIVSKGRRAGLIDWTAIVDRTRMLRGHSAWDSPNAIVETCAAAFQYDPWRYQPHYVEVWFEKDALLGVFERAGELRRLPIFSCRGYPSDSEVWGAAQRLARQARRHEQVVVLHFGDHDPSGIDMTRDIGERLALFGAHNVEVRRLALNMEQVEEYDPPPNPAKESDSRFADYQAKYGDESWELDALEPSVLAQLVTDELAGLLDMEQWEATMQRERKARRELTAIAEQYDTAVAACGIDEDDGDEE
jgi:hypothetical protein